MSGNVPLPATPIDLPLLPLRDVVVFPHMVIPLFVGRPKSIKALETAMAADRRIMLVAQKAAAKDEPSVNDMFEVGCVSTILQMLKLPDGTVKVLVEGQQRATVTHSEDGEAHFVGTVTPLDLAASTRWSSAIRTSSLRSSAPQSISCGSCRRSSPPRQAIPSSRPTPCGFATSAGRPRVSLNA